MVMTLLTRPKTTIATIVVALDGSGHTTDIQEGIDLLPAEGGSVYIKEGTYNIIARININKENVKIEGVGNGTIIQSVISDYIIYIAAGNLILLNFKIVAMRNSTEAILLEDPYENIIIENIFIDGNNKINSYGIALVCVPNTLSNVRISKCFIKDCGSDGIVFGGNNNVISQCTIDNNAYGISTDGATNCSIIGNVCKNCGLDGIAIASDNFLSNNNVVSGNTCSSNRDGISVWDDCNENLLSSNQCNSNSGYGIHIRLNTTDKTLLTGNICLNNTTGQINDAGTDTHLAHNITT